MAPIREYFAPRGIELDPATEVDNPTGAREFFTEEDDGLSREWRGNVFLNPPYGAGFRTWAEKVHGSASAGAHIVALFPPTRAETGYWQEHILTEYLTALCYVRRRVGFLRPSGEKATSNVYGSVLHLFNGDADRFAACLGKLGRCVRTEVYIGGRTSAGR